MQVQRYAILLFLLSLSQGCATASVWDTIKPSAFKKARYLGIPNDDKGSIVVGFVGKSANSEEWFLLKPGKPGPESFWVRLGDEAKARGCEVVVPPELETKLQTANAEPIAKPPKDVTWLSASPIGTLRDTSSGLTHLWPTTYALQIDTNSEMLFDPKIDERRKGNAASGETILLLPRAPKRAQTGAVVVATLVTPFTFLLDVITFPISIPAAAWRPGTGP